MGVLITARDPSVTQGLKTYATEKGEKLKRFFNGITKCEIILDADGQDKRAEIVLHIQGAPPIVSHAEHEQLNAAIDLAVDKSEKQLRKHKDKLRDHRVAELAPEPEPEPAEKLESYDEIIEKRDFPK